MTWQSYRTYQKVLGQDYFQSKLGKQVRDALLSACHDKEA